MTKLVGLHLAANQLTDLTPLAGLTELRKLELDRNPNVTKAEILRLQKALPKCNITHDAKFSAKLSARRLPPTP